MNGKKDVKICRLHIDEFENMAFLISCFEILGIFYSVVSFCPDSLKTMKIVDDCPETLDAWKIKALEKQCEVYNQTCTDRSKFMYHCVVNPYLNETIEVCAPSAFIMGYCCEFNAVGAVIQRNYKADCRKFLVGPCTEPYFSYEGYKYPGCYDLVHRRSYQNTTIISHTENTTTYVRTENGLNTDKNLAVYIAFGVFVVFLLLVHVSVLLYRQGILLRFEHCCCSRDQNPYIDPEDNQDTNEESLIPLSTLNGRFEPLLLSASVSDAKENTESKNTYSVVEAKTKKRKRETAVLKKSRIKTKNGFDFKPTERMKNRERLLLRDRA